MVKAKRGTQAVKGSMLALAAAAAAQVLVSGGVVRGDVLISQDWPETPPTGDGWYRIAGFTDYAQGQAPANGAGISRVDQGGDFKLQYVNAGGQYWGQIVGQSWANPGITVPNMKANPVVEFDLDLSGANWGALTLKADIESKGTSTGDITSTHNYDFSHLTVKDRGSNPITQHMSIDLAQLSIPVQNIESGTGDQNLLLYFQPAYYGFWDESANGGAGAWVDQYVTQTYRIDNMWLTSEPVKVNAAWAGDVDGNFSDATKWAGGLPGGAGHTANFGSTKSAGGDPATILSHTITVDAPVTLGVLNFYNSNSQTLAGASAITLTGSAHVAPAINVAAGSHTISAPLTVTADTSIDVSNASSTLTLSNVSSAGVTLTKKGGGKLAVANVRAAGLNIAAGTVVIGQNGGSAGASKVAALTIGANATLDLKDNKLVTNAPIGTFAGGAYTGVQGDIARAYDFGSWDLPGLMTSMPDAGPAVGTTTLAASDGASILFLGPTETGTWAGQQVTGSSTLVMYTYAGDVNFDGLVDASDYGIIDNYFQFPGTTGYANGDFNYDGVIDAGDYGIIDNAFQLQGAPLPSGASSTAAGISGVTSVPEPATASVVLVGAAVASAMRRRRRRET